jgi:hypothetical protein
LARRRALDELRQAPLARLGLLRAGDPVDGGAAVGRRLGLEERPRALVGAQSSLLVGLELGGPALLVGVDRRAVVCAALEGGEAGRGDEAFLVLRALRGLKRML